MPRCTLKLIRLSLLSSIIALALISPSAVWAIPVKWSLDAPIQLNGGGTISGFFIYDADIPSFSEAMLTVAGRAGFDGVYNQFIRGTAFGADFAKAPAPADLIGVVFVGLNWSGDLTNSGGTLTTLGPVTGYIGQCTDIVCSRRNIPVANVPSNSWAITGQPVPEPTTLALFASGLLGLAGYRWHQRRRERAQVG